MKKGLRKTKKRKYMFLWTKTQPTVCDKQYRECRDIVIRVYENNIMFDNYRYRNNPRMLRTCKRRRCWLPTQVAVWCETINQWAWTTGWGVAIVVWRFCMTKNALNLIFLLTTQKCREIIFARNKIKKMPNFNCLHLAGVILLAGSFSADWLE